MGAHRIRSTGKRLAIVLLAIAWSYAQLAPGHAHELRYGRLIFPSGSPVMGRPADVHVVILGADDKPAPLIDTQVYVTADMTVHPMTPITTELALLSDRERAGTISFSMPGDWRVKLEIVEPDEDERVAVVRLRVLPSDAATSATPLTLSFGLDAPLRQTVFDPWLVVWTSLGLVAALEGVAVGRYLHRRKRIDRASAESLLR